MVVNSQRAVPRKVLYSSYANLTKNELISVSAFDDMFPSLAEKGKDSLCRHLSGHIFWKNDRRQFIKAFSVETLLEAFRNSISSHEYTYRVHYPNHSDILYVSCREDVVQDLASGDVFSFFSIVDATNQVLLENLVYNGFSRAYEFVTVVEEKTGKIVFSFNGLLAQDFMTQSASYNEKMIAFLKKTFVGDVLDKIFRSLSLDAIRSGLKDNTTYSYQYSLTDVHNVSRTQEISCHYVEDDCEYVCITCTDITDIIAEQEIYKEELVTALAEAEKANKAKTEFLSRMSHDTRTPLNGIIGLTELACGEKDPIVIQNYLSQIALSGKFLLGLINDVLDMSRIESGKIELHQELCTHTDLLAAIKPIIQPLCDAKHQAFTINFMQGFPAFVADKLRLNQICINLLSNASKYTPDGGKVSFVMRYFNAGRDSLTGIRLEVIDNGIGISKEYIKSAFEPFSREETGSTAKTQGTGLGLAIVSSLVQMMHGRINIESNEGKGTRVLVHLVFPVVTSSLSADVQPPAPQFEEEKLKLSGKRILLAEDNLINATIVKNILEKEHITVERAKNGKEAVEMFMETESAYYSAILMDVRMPITDGLAATRMIRALTRPDAVKVPIIALTANAFEENVKECLDAGMNAHLAKPLDPKRMFEVLSTFLCCQVGDSADNDV